MYLPGTSTTDVLGYQLFINDANSNAIPNKMIYDGRAVSNVQQVTATALISDQSYWLAYKVLNRVGWSNLSPILQIIAGQLPAAPLQPPYQIAVSDSSVTFGWWPTTDVGGAAILQKYNVYIQGTKVASVSSTTL